MDKKSRRSIWLISGTFFYLIFGAIIFSFFEFDEELRQKREIQEIRNSMQNKYNFTKKDFERLEEVVVRGIPLSAGLQWKFIGAVYFCTVVITTVGYGHSTPNTIAGKLFCMIFALIGIPLGLVMFQSIGERINYFIRCFLINLGKLLSKRGIHVFRNVKPRHLLFVSFSIGSLTIIIGTYIFHRCEKWTWFDAYYYCVITLSTIGFGDYVAAQTQGRLQNDVGYVIFTLFFILFGLAIFSACVNLLILEFMAYNADIVTAKTRLKRLLSLRRTDSSCKTSLTTTRSFPTTTYVSTTTDVSLNKAASMATLINPTNFNNLSNNIKSISKSHSSSSSIKDAYKYYRYKPHFAVRRLPIQYVDHLVYSDLSDHFSRTMF